MPSPRAVPPLLCALVLLVLVPAAQAADDTVTIDFEHGPAVGTPITDEYRTSSFAFFQRSDGPRPYRKAAPGKARSGTVVADVGAGLCVPEGGTGSDCEFPVGGTVGRLTRTATQVRLFAGLFTASEQPVTVQLRAFRADGSVAATGAAVPVTAAGFTTEVSVASAQADIARYAVIVGGAGNIGAAVGFDDLTFTFPQGTLPEVSLSTAPDAVAVRQGATVDVPVAVTRLNGSDGPLDLAISGLPLGVTAQLLPDPVPGTTGAATVRLTAAPDAPRSALDVPTTITVTGDPQGNGSVAPGPRTTTFPLRVATNYELRARSGTAVSLPTCGTTDVELRLERDRSFTGTVKFTVTGVPAGVTAAFVPGDTVASDGNFFAGVALRLTAPTAPIPSSRLTVTASSPGVPSRSVDLTLDPASGTAALTAPASRGLTAPQFGREGTLVRLEGNGLCPGTTVRVGNEAADAPVELAPDGRSLTFRTPRLATSGTVTVVPPQGPRFGAGDVTVASYRNTHGLRFGNFPYAGLSLSEAADVFGYDELFMKVNPCWPWASCDVITPIPDPTAFIAYGIIDAAMQSTGGHCFGISRAVQGWRRNSATLNRWTSGTTYDIAGRTGALDSYLDGQHALQASAEFLRAWFLRDQSIAAQLQTIRDQLAGGNEPLVSMAYDGGGHAVVAYDVVDRPDGGVDVLLYDNNVPFTAGELTNGNDHRAREQERSVLRISPDRRRWEFQSGTLWSGGGDALFVTPYNVIPTNPSLPGGYQLLEGLAYLVFGSADGAVRTETTSPDYLPLLDDAAPPRSGGVVGGKAGAPLENVLRGVAKGRYQQALVADGTIASVDAPTGAGVRDAVRAADDGLTFAALGSTPPRRIELAVATKPDRGASLQAVVRTTTRGGGTDTARLAGGRTLTFVHDGAATTASFELTRVAVDGGPQTFRSGSLRVGRGDTVRLAPVRAGSLDAMRVTVRSKRGRTRARVLRNRATPPASLRIASLRVRGRVASAAVRFARLPQYAAGGVVLRAVRGTRTVARKTFPLASVKAGTRRLTWTLPRSVGRGALTIKADATVAVGGARTGTVRRARTLRTKVR